MVILLWALLGLLILALVSWAIYAGTRKKKQEDAGPAGPLEE